MSCVCISVQMHTTPCAQMYFYTQALHSCQTLSTAGPAQARVGVGGPAEVFESSPLPPGHAHSSVTGAPCAQCARAQSPVLVGLLKPVGTVCLP